MAHVRRWGLWALLLAFVACWVGVQTSLPSTRAWDCLEASDDVDAPCWRLKPDCDGLFEGFGRPHPGTPYQTNALGFRGPLPSDADQRARRIGVLGASTIFGYGVTDAQTWRVHAQKQVDQRLGQGRIQLLNLAVAGYDLHKQIAHAEHHRKLGINSFIFAVDLPLLGAVDCRVWWRTQSHAARVIAPLRWWYLRDASTTNRPGQAEVRATLEQLADWRRKHPEVDVWLAVLAPLGDKPGHQAQVASVNQAGIGVLDLSEALAVADTGRSPTATAYLLDNGEGWNAKGHVVLGNALAGALIANVAALPATTTATGQGAG